MMSEIERVSNSIVYQERKAVLSWRNSADWVTSSARLIGHRFGIQVASAPGDSVPARAWVVGRAV